MKLKALSQPVDSRVVGVSQRISEWRRDRRHSRAPMPEELWRSVIELTDRYSAYQLARMLGLAGKKISQRMKEADTPEPVDVPKVVRLAPLVFESPAPKPASTSIEIENASGQKLRVTTSGDAAADLVKMFLGGAK